MRLSTLPKQITVDDPLEQRAAVVVLGLGNTLLGDDGVGVQVVQHLQAGRRLPSGIRFLDGGTLSFSLLEDIENTDSLIVVDAAQLGEEPGSVHIYRDLAMDEFLRSRRSSSVHEVSLAELLDMARLTGHLPERRALVAIQPQHIDWNTEVSPDVRGGLETACIHVRALITRWSI
ncbi:MAG: HyaD/HybD family hydrogenase maturation endopeptidase [Gammaproteobacteria bacterium]|nr:HyaD/HybD family hydrogenase maturation endopeptidase [Gammaproteobacteria bacterium]MDE2345087.1 HyaD/HybD family hydrogenase maturation endopeptidase [Gammaproteobacteria bacterium]